MPTGPQLYDGGLMRRQPGAASTSGAAQTLRASTAAASAHHGRRGSCGAAGSRRACRTRSLAVAASCGQDDGSVYTPPAWHPRLPCVPSTKRGLLERAARSYYLSCWNQGATEVLDEIASPGVVFSDVLGLQEDGFGVAPLRTMIEDFQAAHPLLRFALDALVVDEDHDTLVVHYTATAAHLLPGRSGVPASGHVSSVRGMDKLRFDRFGHITSIESYRERFANEEEQLQLADWDSL